MTNNENDILPGWTLKVDEFSPGAYRITFTDKDGRKAEIVDDYNELSLDKCIDYAFGIEVQTNRNWNKFLYDFSNLKLNDMEIDKNEYHDKYFGSWTIQTKSKRILLDGKNGWLIYEEIENGEWVDKETIMDYKHVTYEQFKGFINYVK